MVFTMTIKQDRKNTILTGEGLLELNDNIDANPIYGEWRCNNDDGIEAVKKYNDIIESISKEKGVNSDWVRSIVYLENAHGGVYGYAAELIDSLLPGQQANTIYPMNIHKDYWSDLLPEGGDFYEPKDNISAGVELIKRITENLAPEDRSFDKVASLYYNLGLAEVHDYGARAQNILEHKLWEDPAYYKYQGFFEGLKEAASYESNMEYYDLQMKKVWDFNMGNLQDRYVDFEEFQSVFKDLYLKTDSNPNFITKIDDSIYCGLDELSQLDLQKTLDDYNTFSQIIFGKPALHETEAGETLLDIANRYGTTVSDLLEVNSGLSENQSLAEDVKVNLPDSITKWSGNQYTEPTNLKVYDNNTNETIEYNIQQTNPFEQIAQTLNISEEVLRNANSWFDTENRTSTDGSYWFVKDTDKITIPTEQLNQSTIINNSDGSRVIINYEDGVVEQYNPEYNSWQSIPLDSYLTNNSLEVSFDSETQCVADYGNYGDWDGVSERDNSILDFVSNINPDSNNATKDPANDWWENSFVMTGGDWWASIPSDILNEDSYVNQAISKIPANYYRPGNEELTDDTFEDILWNATDFVQENSTPIPDGFYENGGFNYDEPNYTPVPDNFYENFSNYGELNNLFLEIPNVENVDPLVLDLNNNGVELISFEDSNVSFDVDNDGYIENTGWVKGTDGIVVHDKNGDGVINDITETISEYYTENVADGLEALKTLDSNDDGVFDSNDEMWNTLRVWTDTNEDGVNQSGEMHTFGELGIESIDLERTITYRERIEGNPVLSRSTMTMTDGTTRDVAAVDFATNPIGYEWNDAYEAGAKVSSEDGESSSYVVTSEAGATVDVATEGVNSAYGNIGDDTLIGDDGDNWLMGGKGSDTLIGGAGNDLLLIDSEDLNENIDGGEGRDIVRVVGEGGVYFNMSQSNIEIFNGGDGNDIIIGGGNSNVFMGGGTGDDVMIGGAADDALAGEDGNDMLDGGYGDDILRGHRGEDLLVGGLGNDYLEGGLGDDTLKGGEGNDILIGNEGNDTIDGGEGFDMVEYSGKYDQYTFSQDENGVVIVTDTVDGSVDTITNVERLRFNHVDVNLNDTNALPLPVKDNIAVESGTTTLVIDPASILSNDFSTSGKELSIKEVSDAVGGTVSIREDGMIVFEADPYFTGTLSFDYTVQDTDGNYATISKENSDGVVETVPLKAQVNLVNESDPTDPLYYDQWYLSEIRVKTAWEDYSGKGINIGIFEGDYGNPLNHEHEDLNDNISDYYLSDVLYEEDVEGYSNHATLVAGVIAAEKNGLGSVGIAYDSEISSHTWDSGVDGINNLMNYDVANNSWTTAGLFADDFVTDFGNEVIFQERGRGIQNAVDYGRDGLGTSIIFAGGNAREEGDNVNYHNTQNSRMVSTIGSINQEGDLSKLIEASDPFSNPGSSILVSAPGSNIKSTANMIQNDNGSTFGTDFESTQGTSFSAPITTGVVALMLEANERLGYRDIQTILASTARIVEDSNTTWLYNGATNWNGGGMHYSEDYGFGIIDAHAAVRLAETWIEINNTLNEEVITNSNNTAQALIDNGQITSTIDVSSNIDIEYVEVYVDIDHTRIGDLVLTLVSPDGTESILVNRPGKAPGSDGSDLGLEQDGLKFQLSTTNCYGENGTGIWTLKVEDKATGEVGTLNSWSLSVYGANDDGNNTFIFTDEFDKFTTDEINILDVYGIDTVNASSLLTDSLIDLRLDEVSNIDGRNVKLSNSATEEFVIEKTAQVNSLEESLITKNSELTTLTETKETKELELSTDLATRSTMVSEGNPITIEDIDAKLAEYYVALDAFNVDYDNYMALKTDWDRYEFLTWYSYSNNGIPHPNDELFFKVDGQTVVLRRYEAEAKIDAVNNALDKAIASQDVKNNLADEYNQMINDYNGWHETLNNLNTNIDTLTEEVSNLEDSIFAKENEITSTQNQIDTLNRQITEYQDADTILENAYGGDGNDTLIGNEFDNLLFGGRGDDTLTGNAGNDTFEIFQNENQTDTITDFEIINTEEKIDLTRFKFNSFEDLIINQQDSDTVIDLGSGQTLILKNIDSSLLTTANFKGFLDKVVTLDGTSDNDNLYADERDSIINGGAGDDYISGSTGNNTLTGGEGSDLFFIDINPNKTDTITDFDINDVNERISLRNFKDIRNIDNLNITQEGLNSVITLDDGQKIVLNNVNKESLSNKNFIFFREILGTSGDDKIVGSDLPDVIYGGDGADAINGYQWDDYIAGGNGNDLLDGGHGDDTLYGNAGHDILRGGIGSDTIYGGDGDDYIAGGNVAIEEDNDNKGNLLFGGNGDDEIHGDSGNDEIHDGAGADIVYGGTGNDIIHLEGQNQQTSFSGDINTAFVGEGGDDTFVIHKDIYGLEGTGILNDIIYDFEVNNPNEKIDLTAFKDVRDFSDLRFSNVTLNGNQFLRVYVAGNESDQYISLKGVYASDLSSSNFIFYENNSPILNLKEATTNEDNSVILDVLSQAIDADGDALDVIFVANGSNGTASIITDENGKQFVKYTPNENFNGIDTITYGVDDGYGSQVFTTLKVTVNPVNDAPEVLSKEIMINGNNPVEVDVLSGATDIEGDALAIDSVEGSSNGTVNIVDNKLVYTPDEDFSGLDIITYTVSDGNGGSVTQTLNITVRDSNTLTAEGDNFYAEDFFDTDYYINGLEGNDDINTHSGDDILFGGEGNDYLSAGAGSNELTGGLGTDVFAINENYNPDSESILNTIKDFEINNPFEKIDLRILSDIQDISQLDIVQSGDNTVINLGDNNTLILENTDSSLLTNQNFVFYTNEFNTTPFSDDIYIVEYDENVTINAKEGNDSVQFYTDVDYASINTGAGDDIISIGAFNSDITAGVGNDLFSINFEAESYPWSETPEEPVTTRTTINDFETNNSLEKIIIKTSELVSFDDLILTQIDSDVLIQIDGKQHEVLLKNTAVSDLSANNFEFLDINTGFTSDENGIVNGTILSDYMSLDYEEDISVAYGGGGNDEIDDWSLAGNIYAGNGNDGIWVYNPYDFGFTEMYSDLNLVANQKNIYGEAGNDIFVIDHDNGFSNIANGGDGNDSFTYKVGDWTLIGGEGNDSFIIEKSPNSTVTIEDFDINNIQEFIKFDLFGEELSGFYDLNITQIDNDTHIILPDNQKVILKNINSTDLVKDNFLFITTNNEESGVINGLDRSDIIYGRDGDDAINANDGSDLIFGGEGEDLFAFTRDAGASPENQVVDEIMDFDINSEKVTLTNFDNITSFEELDIKYYNTEYDMYEDVEYFAIVSLGNNQFIKIHNTDQNNPLTADNFIINNSPVLANAIAEQNYNVNDYVNIDLSSVFSDANVGVSDDALDYSVKLSDGSNLPSYLTFNPDNLTLSGIIPNNITSEELANLNNLDFVFKATDSHELSAETSFSLNVVDDRNVIEGNDATSTEINRIFWAVPDSYQVVDFDGDGILDIVSDWGDNGLDVRYYNEDGSYQWQRLTYSAPEKYELVDFDGDGCLDLVADWGTTGIELTNYANRQKTDWQRLTWSRPNDFKILDFDGDGNLDFIADWGDKGIDIRYYDSEGNYDWDRLTWSAPVSYEMIDFNGDGNLDFIADWGQYGVQLQTYGSSREKLEWKRLSWSSPQDMKIIDFDGDGNLDVVNDWGANGIDVTYYNSDGTTEWQRLSYTAPEKYELIDFDGDGSLDFVVDWGDKGIELTKYANRQKGNWGKLSWSQPQNYYMIDVDGDGNLDMLTDWGANGIDVRYYNNDGSYGWQRLTWSAPTSYSITDFDGDGAKDLFIDWGANGVEMKYLNNRGVKQNINFTEQFSDYKFADVNNDGVDDIVLNKGENGLHWYNTLTEETTSITENAVQSYEAKDMDNDGIVDVMFDDNGQVWKYSAPTKGSDIINGTDSNDVLNGRGGDDIIDGGFSTDNLFGGQGDDTFSFSALEDSSINSSDLNNESLTYSTIDTIHDFTQGEDQIDLSALGFDGIVEGDGYVLDDNDDGIIDYNDNDTNILGYHNDGLGNTIIEDSNSDFAIKLIGEYDLTDDDLMVG